MWKLIPFAALSLALISCQEATRENTAATPGNEPVKVGDAFGCPIYLKKIKYKVGEVTVARELYITICPEIKSISFPYTEGKQTKIRTWQNLQGEF